LARPSRTTRLGEALDIIQGLLSAKLQSYRGQHFRLDNARLFDRPKIKPRVIVAAGGPRAARLAATKADGLIATEPLADLIDTFKSAGGSGPRYAEVGMCWAEEEEEAQKTAHRYFRWSLTGWPVQAELPDTEGFAAASQHITPEMVAQQISCGPSLNKHLDAIEKFVKAGFDHIILVQIGRDQDYFLEAFHSKLAFELRGLKAA
jgi:G6PDH family F420-dependent oxidoreductase